MTTRAGTPIGRRSWSRLSIIGLIGGVVLAGGPEIAAAQNYAPVLSVQPAHPAPGAQVEARVFMPIGGCAYGSREVVIDGRNIRVVQTIYPPIYTLPGTCLYGWSIGPLPVGRYRLEWQDVYAYTPPERRSLGMIEFLVGDGGPPLPIPVLHDLKWLALTMLLLLGVTRIHLGRKWS